MRLFLLKPIKQVPYDSYDAKLVRAPSERSARLLANITTGDEGKIWTDPGQVTCEIVTVQGTQGEIIASFCAG